MSLVKTDIVHSAPGIPKPRGGPLDLGDLSNSIEYLVSRIHRLIFTGFSTHLAAFGLRPLTFAALTVIERNPGRKQSEVADALGIQRTNFVATVDEMLKKLWIDRAPIDRRSYALHLSEGGAAVLKAAAAERVKVENEWDLSLSPAKKSELTALLRQIIEASSSDPTIPRR